MSDFLFTDHGSVCILTPITREARCWIEDHVDPGAMNWGKGVVIEPRYCDDILSGIADDGLSVN